MLIPETQIVQKWSCRLDFFGKEAFFIFMPQPTSSQILQSLSFSPLQTVLGTFEPLGTEKKEVLSSLLSQGTCLKATLGCLLWVAKTVYKYLFKRKQIGPPKSRFPKSDEQCLYLFILHKQFFSVYYSYPDYCIN